MISPLVPLSARDPRQSVLTADCRGNLNNAPAREGLIASERGNPFLHDLTNETRPVIGRHFAVPFNIIPFHGGACGD